jgi:two-component system response regulator GlrR
LPFKDATEQFEKGYLEEMLHRANGRVSEAAKLADLNRRSFYSKMSKYNMSRDDQDLEE